MLSILLEVSPDNPFYTQDAVLSLITWRPLLTRLYFSDPVGESSSSNYTQLSKLMTSMWASFVHDLDPNNHNQTGVPQWPAYANGGSKASNVVGGYGENFLFQIDPPSQPEPDTFRAEGIAYMNTLWASEFGK